MPPTSSGAVAQAPQGLMHVCLELSKVDKAGGGGSVFHIYPEVPGAIDCRVAVQVIDPLSMDGLGNRPAAFKCDAEARFGEAIDELEGYDWNVVERQLQNGDDFVTTALVAVEPLNDKVELPGDWTEFAEKFPRKHLRRRSSSSDSSSMFAHDGPMRRTPSTHDSESVSSDSEDDSEPDDSDAVEHESSSSDSAHASNRIAGQDSSDEN